MSVTVQYNPKIVLTGDQVEDRGEIFDCSRCSSGSSCVCCNNLNNDRANGCRKCSCQSKIPSTIDCIAGGGACYYKDKGQCSGSCSSACSTTNGSTNNCFLNRVLYDTTRTSSLSTSCSDAQIYINNPSIIGQVTNANQINTQCSTNDQLRCCKGDSTLGAQLCGQYWGPTNTEGQCKHIVT